MQENAKAAVDRRRKDSKNAVAAAEAMRNADDCFTTCQTCHVMIAVRFSGGAWLTEHRCGAKGS